MSSLDYGVSWFSYADQGFDLHFQTYVDDGPTPSVLDPSFGSGGVAINSLSAPATANDVALFPGGKLVVTGTIDRHNGDVLVARYRSDGHLDGFGSSGNGTVAFDVNDNSAQGFNSIESGDSVAVASDSSLFVGYKSTYLSLIHI